MTDDAPANGTPEHPADGPAAPPAPPSASGAMTPPAGAIVTDPVDPTTDDRGAGGAPPPPARTGLPGPGEPGVPTRATRAGVTAGVVALGTGLVAAAAVVAAVRSRDDGDRLDWSVYGVGLGATAVLLVIAVLGALAARRPGGRAREDVVTWPGSVGILATALMIGIGIDRDDDWVAYLVGGTMVALAVVGYLAARRAAFVVVAILGLALVYAVAFDGVVSDSIGEDHPQVASAVLLTLFVVVVTLLGWALPSRAVSGVVVGTLGLVGLLGILASFAVMRFFSGILGGMSGILPGGEPSASPAGGAHGFHESDVWWVVALAGILAVLWALGAAVANHSGFAVLAIAMTALGVPLASVALAAEHPTWWAAITASAGGLMLLGAVLLARLRGRRLEAGSRQSLNSA